MVSFDSTIFFLTNLNVWTGWKCVNDGISHVTWLNCRPVFVIEGSGASQVFMKFWFDNETWTNALKLKNYYFGQYIENFNSVILYPTLEQKTYFSLSIRGDLLSLWSYFSEFSVLVLKIPLKLSQQTLMPDKRSSMILL